MAYRSDTAVHTTVLAPIDRSLASIGTTPVEDIGTSGALVRNVVFGHDYSHIPTTIAVRISRLPGASARLMVYRADGMGVSHRAFSSYRGVLSRIPGSSITLGRHSVVLRRMSHHRRTLGRENQL